MRFSSFVARQLLPHWGQIYFLVELGRLPSGWGGWLPVSGAPKESINVFRPMRISFHPLLSAYLRTQLSQRGFSDQGSIDAAKKEISRRRQEINTLNESLFQLQAEAENIQQQLSETLSAVPEQYKSEVLTHEPPKEEKYRGRAH